MARGYGALEWLWGMLGLQQRLFSVSAALASLWVAWKVARGWRRGERALGAAGDAALLFLVTGWLYMAVFNWGAWQHHYWPVGASTTSGS